MKLVTAILRCRIPIVCIMGTVILTQGNLPMLKSCLYKLPSGIMTKRATKYDSLHSVQFLGKYA